MQYLQISDETVEERQQFPCTHHNKHSHGEPDEDLEKFGELFRKFVLSYSLKSFVLSISQGSVLKKVLKINIYFPGW